MTSGLWVNKWLKEAGWYVVEVLTLYDFGGLLPRNFQSSKLSQKDKKKRVYKTSLSSEGRTKLQSEVANAAVLQKKNEVQKAYEKTLRGKINRLKSTGFIITLSFFQLWDPFCRRDPLIERVVHLKKKKNPELHLCLKFRKSILPVFK